MFLGERLRKLLMRERVRVGLGGVTGRNGTICSEYYYWRCFRSLKKTQGVWADDATYDGNVIKQGNLAGSWWGDVPVDLGAQTVTISTNGQLPAGSVSNGYNTTLQANGGTSPYRWTMDSGQLPKGLSLNSTTGEISGTPAADSAGTYTFVIEAKDSAASPANPDADLKVFTLTINSAP